jgi:hypothetical protein
MQVGRVVSAPHGRAYAFVRLLHGGGPKEDIFIHRNTARWAARDNGPLPHLNGTLRSGPPRFFQEGDWVIFTQTNTPKGPAAEPWTLYESYMQVAADGQASKVATQLVIELPPLIKAAYRTSEELRENAEAGCDDSYRQAQITARDRQIRLCQLAGVPAELLALAMGDSLETFNSLHYLEASFEGCRHQGTVHHLAEPHVLELLRQACNFEARLADPSHRGAIPTLPGHLCPQCTTYRIWQSNPSAPPWEDVGKLVVQRQAPCDLQRLIGFKDVELGFDVEQLLEDGGHYDQSVGTWPTFTLEVQQPNGDWRPVGEYDTETGRLKEVARVPAEHTLGPGHELRPTITLG